MYQSEPVRKRELLLATFIAILLLAGLITNKQQSAHNRDDIFTDYAAAPSQPGTVSPGL